MQVIHFTEAGIGSFDWELPKKIADDISSLPKEDQEYVLQQLKINIHAYLHMILGATRMGDRTDIAFSVIRTSQMELIQMLKVLTR